MIERLRQSSGVVFRINAIGIIDSFPRVFENFFELLRGPKTGTEPSDIAFPVSRMFVLDVSCSDFDQVFENLTPAFLLVFCGHFITAIDHLLDYVSVDGGIVIHQLLEFIEHSICGGAAQHESSNR